MAYWNNQASFLLGIHGFKAISRLKMKFLLALFSLAFVASQEAPRSVGDCPDLSVAIKFVECSTVISKQFTKCYTDSPKEPIKCGCDYQVDMINKCFPICPEVSKSVGGALSIENSKRCGLDDKTEGSQDLASDAASGATASSKSGGGRTLGVLVAGAILLI
jgi:hypothetical protein